MAAAAPKASFPLRHAVRPRCDSSESLRNHQPFPCPLGFASLGGGKFPPPRHTVMPRGCRGSEVLLWLSLATCLPSGCCPQACPPTLSQGVPCTHSGMVGDQEPVGRCRPAAPLTRGLTAMGCSWLPTGSVLQDPTPLPTVSRAGISLQWHHGRARMHQPRQLHTVRPKPTITHVPSLSSPSLLPQRNHDLDPHPLLAAGRAGDTGGSGPAPAAMLGWARGLSSRVLPCAELPRPAGLGPRST